jgi:phospholipid/cholesterol/gamma-HCH transport system substrate-binding protein
MDTHTQKFKIRLGLFVAGGLALFVFAIFIIGKQKNLFNPVFQLSTTFHNVSGLQVGNNVRFSGINVGTVDDISILNDSTVKVKLLIKEDVRRFIKTDCIVAIGSEGLIGDRLVVITQGSFDAPEVKEGQQLASTEPTETDAIMASLKVTAGNAEIISEQVADIMIKINSGNGTLGRLIQDSTIAENLSQTMQNLKTSSKGLDQNMEAAKHNFLLRGYFNKKEAAAEKVTEDSIKAVKKQQKADDKAKKKEEKQK